MQIEIQITREPIAEKIFPPAAGTAGAWVEFRGVVRGEENGKTISALEYEAYSPMAENEMRRILQSLTQKFPCLAAKVIHRIGIIRVGETAIYVGIAAKHRAEAFALLAEFINRLKQDVPIWKRRAIENLVAEKSAVTVQSQLAIASEEAVAKIHLRCQLLSAVRVSLEECRNQILREKILAVEDFPATDKSTRDGYAILQNDSSDQFQVVDTIHAADWKPRQLKSGEAVRVATGASLPCENLRVVMQENVSAEGEKIKIMRRESSANVRLRGEDLRAGQTLMSVGEKLDAGKIALLAATGMVNPLVSPRLRVLHFTTGDEIVSSEKIPQPGQIRDSNSFLIRGLLEKYNCAIHHKHLPENFTAAKSAIEEWRQKIEDADLLLVSGGASVGEKDFTRELLEWLGFEIVFSQVNIRPGRPLIFGAHRNQIAFGLPGNPLSHFVCFHLFVAVALAKMAGGEPQKLLRAKLAAPLADDNPRETFWPARFDFSCGELYPLKWSSSGDVTCFTAANALIRVPANGGLIEAGAQVEFLPA
jgi:molybdopterin molybdotransferase